MLSPSISGTVVDSGGGIDRTGRLRTVADGGCTQVANLGRVHMNPDLFRS